MKGENRALPEGTTLDQHPESKAVQPGLPSAKEQRFVG
jgi:hypothetical protein